jgi:geranylgeranyl diphosphate synthase type II
MMILWMTPLRRGIPPFMKNGMLILILSGDAMLILAYQYFEQYEPAVFMIGKII